ncbi:MAG: carbamoyltransferase HypF, partial [Gammaproteobacteria bacterium]
DRTLTPWQLDWRPLIVALLADRAAGVAGGLIALRFHHALAAAALAVAQHAGRRVVCLSGGCFQNPLLTRLVRARLEQGGWQVCSHAQVPPNDGGLALGQAMIVARQEAR